MKAIVRRRRLMMACLIKTQEDGLTAMEEVEARSGGRMELQSTIKVWRQHDGYKHRVTNLPVAAQRRIRYPDIILSLRLTKDLERSLYHS
jgi:hypothetical protein